MRFVFLCSSVAMGLLSSGSCVVTADEAIDFNRDIRPLLADRCYACHGPDAGQRQGGGDDGLRLDREEGSLADLGGHAAIVPGKPDESELVRRILSTDPEEMMPPPAHRKKLSDAEKQLLVRWITDGAQWADHWSFIPPKRFDPPTVRDAAWPRNLIDNFILARLESRGLTPSSDADRTTLLRRLSFDLTGLPPTMEEVHAFVSDKSPDAWERAVDRLLASEHFGERLAIYWLDLVRYADTVGYHGDQDISVSPYRDYVIDAFNSNMPFDRFTREQIAGDLIPDATRDQRIASGYNRLGMMSAEGGVQPKEYLAKYASDRVRTASSVWLGTTLGCAECHDHKFDPFSTKDFYQFASFFADIKEQGLYSGANFGEKMDVPDVNLPRLLQPIDANIAAHQATLDAPTPELIAAQQAWETDVAGNTTQWHPLSAERLDALHGTSLKQLDDGTILAEGVSADSNTYTLTIPTTLKDMTGFQIEVLPHDSLPQKGPGRAGNGNFVLSELRVFLVDGEVETPVGLQNATASIEQTLAGDNNPYKAWAAASVIDNDEKGANWGWAVLPEVGKPQQLVVETSTSVGTGDTKLKIVMDQNHGTNHTIGHFRVSATTSPHPLKAGGSAVPAEITELLAIGIDQRTPEQSAKLAAHYRSIAPALDETRTQLAELQKQREATIAAHTRTTLVTVPVEPREMRVLPRGNWMDDSGEVVTPGVPHFLPQLEIAGDRRASRVDLANWITSRDNPLTARTFVNRLWKLYFGTGLSKVLDDLGVQGEWPTHPQLLDTLAVEFVDRGWDVKHMVKLMVMSHTYQQSSLMRDDLKTVDPYNRLYARQSRHRLDAEMIRDNALAVSGLLVPRIGGRSVKPYQPVGLYQHLNFPAREYQPDDGESQYRRGLYTHWQRQFLHPAMKTFDAPVREECTAERPRSNTPLAALVLLNDPSYVEAARVFAENALRAVPGDDNQRINWMVQQALSRDVTDAEREVLAGLLQSQRAHYAAAEESARQLVATGLHAVPDDVDAKELAAWTFIARAVFNMHEFIARN